jgi:hypothetical protein
VCSYCRSGPARPAGRCDRPVASGRFSPVPLCRRSSIMALPKRRRNLAPVSVRNTNTKTASATLALPVRSLFTDTQARTPPTFKFACSLFKFSLWGILSPSGHRTGTRRTGPRCALSIHPPGGTWVHHQPPLARRLAHFARMRFAQRFAPHFAEPPLLVRGLTGRAPQRPARRRPRRVGSA